MYGIRGYKVVCPRCKNKFLALFEDTVSSTSRNGYLERYHECPHCKYNCNVLTFGEPIAWKR